MFAFDILEFSFLGMNIISLVIAGLSLIALLWGLFAGLFRGSRRALLRLCMVVLCAVGAFFLREPITDLLINFELSKLPFGFAEGTTVTSMLTEMLNGIADFSKLGDEIVLLVKVILNIFSFMIAFFVLKLLTWIIVFPICKIFVKKGKAVYDEETGKTRYKKHKLLGGLFGLVQGFVVALCFLIPLTGLLNQASDIVTLTDSLSNSQQSEQQTASLNSDYDLVFADVSEDSVGETTSSGSTSSGDTTSGSGLSKYAGLINDYQNSFIGKTYKALGDTPFNWIATATDPADGEKLSLNDILQPVKDTVAVLPDMMTAFEKIDFANPSSLDDLIAAAQKLDEIKGNMTDKAKSVFNGMVAGAVSGVVGGESSGELLGVLTDVMEDVDFTEISFANEITTMKTIMTDVQTITGEEGEITQESVNKIIDDVSQSQLAMPIIETLGESAAGELTEEQKQTFEEYLDTAVEENADNQEIVNSFKKLLGITATGVQQ